MKIIPQKRSAWHLDGAFTASYLASRWCIATVDRYASVKPCRRLNNAEKVNSYWGVTPRCPDICILSASIYEIRAHIASENGILRLDSDDAGHDKSRNGPFPIDKSKAMYAMQIILRFHYSVASHASTFRLFLMAKYNESRGKMAK